jgi:hypothetical protein
VVVDGWRQLFVARKSQGTTCVLHAPPPMAFCLPSTFLTVMVLLVVLFVCVYSLVLFVFHSVSL